MDTLHSKLPSLPLSLRQEILEMGMRKNVPAGTELLREGQYVKVIPLVLDGLVKVFSRYEERELLLYYIEPVESCVMSFSAGLWNLPSKVFAITEEQSDLMLLPVQHVNEWVRKYPTLNQLFFGQFNKRYEDLLFTIHQVLFQRMDERLLTYLRERAERLGTNLLDLRHHQIARELGTAREVVSRVMKKLEQEKWVIQHQHGIEILT
ncbi:MAG: Crp/Fnr family transcriptional regulator, partial [Saprospiraceae bacterium]|nr:Crp/Fnr family transcriptional regulator [Saprospiraceae bacterium]